MRERRHKLVLSPVGFLERFFCLPSVGNVNMNAHPFNNRAIAPHDGNRPY